MRNSKTWVRKLSAMAGFAALALTANAFMLDPTITIDRALNSPTLTIRYNGAAAALVELRVNGASLGTRSVSSGKQAGEANFTLDLSTLTEGNNDVEVLLLDKAGRIVGSEKTVITADGTSTSPVTLSYPKMGATVQGPVEIKVGFGREMRNSYVSFFVNNQFKSMTNFAPYSYVWDTQRETNGWHEIEAWLVDENSNTFKTRKVRVFVNNPGGQTGRFDPSTPVAITTPKPVTPAVVTHVVSQSPAAAVKAAGMLRTNAMTLTLAPDSGTKPIPITRATATGTRALVPSAVKPVKVVTPTAPKIQPVIEVTPSVPKVNITKPPTAPVTQAASLLRVTRGFRTPNTGSLVISLNSKVVAFDVPARIQNNVPLTPFRHLIEKAGGHVKWTHQAKTVDAIADGRSIFLHIGDSRAMVNHQPVSLELAPFIDGGRTIVPLSFIESSLNVDVEYDPATGHVLITSKKK